MSVRDILDKPFALRNQMNNKTHHNSKNSVPKEDLTIEKEPHIFRLCEQYAEELATHPNLLLHDTYDEEERKRDWLTLVKKEVISNGEILPIDTRSKPGHKLLDMYMPHFWDVKNYKGISVRDCFTKEKILKALLANVQMHSTPYQSEIRRMLIMTAGLGNVTKYRAATSKAIVQYFGAKSVFDPCVGWGGRMLGTLAAGDDTTYLGCEPDPQTCHGLMSILNDIPNDVRQRADIYNDPVEDVLPVLTNTFDLILTSPPYYNLELYTAGPQSTQSFPIWDKWVADWLKPVVLGCLAHLKPGGTSCWSVKNFRSDKLYPLADVVKEIHKDAGWVLVKTVTMTGSARMGTKRIQEGAEARLSEEETFCFQK